MVNDWFRFFYRDTIIMADNKNKLLNSEIRSEEIIDEYTRPKPRPVVPIPEDDPFIMDQERVKAKVEIQRLVGTNERQCLQTMKKINKSKKPLSDQELLKLCNKISRIVG